MPVQGKHILLASCSGQMGGMELRMIQEAKLLVSLGAKVSVLCPFFEGADHMERQLFELGVPLIPFKSPDLFSNWHYRHINYLKVIFSKRLLSNLHFDLVHIFFSWTDQGLDPLYLASRAGVPAVASVHNAFPYSQFSHWHQKRLREAFKTFKGFYGVSNSSKVMFLKNFENYFKCDSISSAIYNPVDTDRFLPDIQARNAFRGAHAIDDDTFLIGSIGRLDIQKQPLSLIDVFKEVKSRIPKSQLVLVGQGDLEESVRQSIQKHKLDDSVILLGFHDQVEKIIPALDVHMLLSRNEGFGIVSAEAMSCGVPVIGTDVPGTQEVIGGWDSTRLVLFGDVQAAADAIIRIAGHSLKEKQVTSESAREYAKRNFSYEKWEKECLKFYMDIFKII